MTVVALLAKSFIRQNRWLLLAFIFWPFLLGAFVWSPQHAADRQDVFEILQQETFYGIGVVGFLAGSAIYNEKRSRRIVGMLSKGISRTQYLFGLLVGAGLFATLYFAMVGASSIWLLGYSKVVVNSALILIVHGTISSLWLASLALLFSTFLYPFIAAAIAAMLAFGPFGLTHTGAVLAPIVALFGNFDLLSWHMNWVGALIALAESAVLLLLGAQIFRHRDVTVNVE